MSDELITGTLCDTCGTEFADPCLLYPVEVGRLRKALEDARKVVHFEYCHSKRHHLECQKISLALCEPDPQWFIGGEL